MNQFTYRLQRVSLNYSLRSFSYYEDVSSYTIVDKRFVLCYSRSVIETLSTTEVSNFKLFINFLLKRVKTKHFLLDPFTDLLNCTENGKNLTPISNPPLGRFSIVIIMFQTIKWRKSHFITVHRNTVNICLL